MKIPYPHQMKVITETRAAFLNGFKSVLIQAATGFGKTVVSSHIISGSQRKGSRAIFCVHRDNLIKQTANTFTEENINFGLIKSGVHYDPSIMVHIASAQTLIKKLEVVKVPNIFFVDECQLAMSTTYKTIIDFYKSKGVLIVGCSGSPCRLDGKPLGDLFETMVEGPPVRWLIDNGFLSEFKYYAPTIPDLSDIKTVMGDYSKSQLAERLGARGLIGDVIKHYKKLANNKMTIVYCVNVDHSKKVADQFNEAGINAAHIDGSMKAEELSRIYADLADGKIKVLTSVALITEGFDIAAQTGRDVTIECIILLRSTKSLALFLQMVGRGLRKKPYPAIILDHGGNVLVHGMPDEARDWTLDGKPAGGSGASEIQVQPPVICEECYQAVVKPVPDLCPWCDAEMKKQKAVIKIIEGELEEIKAVERLKLKEKLKQEEREANTLEKMILVMQKKGSKNPSFAAKKRLAGRAMRHQRIGFK